MDTLKVEIREALLKLPYMREGSGSTQRFKGPTGKVLIWSEYADEGCWVAVCIPSLSPFAFGVDNENFHGSCEEFIKKVVDFLESPR